MNGPARPVPGRRYRRNAEPHDFVWFASQYGSQVTIRTQMTATNWQSMPVTQFEAEFTLVPKEEKP